MRERFFKATPYVVSLLLHALAGAAIARGPNHDLSRSQTVELEVIERIKPPPPKPPPPPPPAKKPPPVAVAPSPKPEPPPPPDVPPPPNQPPPDERPKQPVRVLAGISLASTTEAGGFAMPVGNTLYGKMPDVAPSPEEVKPYAADRYVPPVEVTELPELIGPPTVDRLKDYPERARQEGIEALCDLLLRVGPDGNVKATLRAECTEKGYEFEDKARLIALRARFKPGKRGGQPVTTDINYKFRFELE